MQTFSQQSAHKPLPKAILLIGPPGGGKTTLLLQFPDLAVLDCDSNLDGPIQYLRKAKPDLSFGYFHIAFSDDGKPRAVEDCYDRLMDCLDEVGSEKAVKTIGIDGLSIISEWVVRKILSKQGRTIMEARDYQPYKSALLDLILKCRSLGKTVIITAHEKRITAADPKKVMVENLIGRRPNIYSSLDEALGGFFTDMWRCELERAPGDKLEAKLTVVRTAYDELKNSLGLPVDGFQPCSYANLKPYLEGTR